ncbi:MAG TPA: hypothetical protein VGI19_01770 [Candidatus Cybelea sp.]|jgi:uncharacterized protein YjbJ (UPF0337 family)
MRTTTILPILAIMLLVVAGCGSHKASDAAQNAANAAGSAAGAAGQAAGNAAGNAAGAAGNAAGAAGNAMNNAGSAASNAASNTMQSAGQAAANMTKPNCGAVQAVWVNTKTRVYHEPGDPRYGRTKHGVFLCPSQAQAQGFRPWAGKRGRTGSASSLQ